MKRGYLRNALWGRDLVGPAPARSPAVHGKKRCRMHGGAPGSGAPQQNQNALKHGVFTQQAIEERKQVPALLQQSRQLLKDIE